jgi:molybdopterin molybdotransferase
MMARDVRLQGFSVRSSLSVARAWLDAQQVPCRRETVTLEGASGRVVATAVVAATDLPLADRAATDGYAVRAAKTEGASAYNSLPLRLGQEASLIAAGTSLPSGTDAILSFESVQNSGGPIIEVLAAVASGEGVERRASQIRAGDLVAPQGRRLRPGNLAVLAALGVKRIDVMARPRVRLEVAGAKPPGAEALVAMLRALVCQDGGEIADEAAELIIWAGRSGVGADDDAAERIAAAQGALDIHGLALRPGGSSGLGRLGGVPLLLLPGEPLACATAYDLLGCPLIRRFAGLEAAPVTRIATLGRKIVSAVGFTEVVQVALTDTLATPLVAGDGGGPATLARADGFVLVPEALEGHAAGESVVVYLAGRL